MNEFDYQKPWIMKRADPYIYKHKDGWYYFTASMPEYDCITLRKSKTLIGLAKAKENIIWRKHDKGIMGAHIWAPELHYLNGKWYIYFAAGEKERAWEIRPFVLECSDDDPTKGKWVEKGIMQCSDDDPFSFRAFSLDATVFENCGKYYFVWAEKVGVGKKISNLYIAEMESPYKLKTVQVLLSTPDYDWERKGFWVNEGPAVIKKEDKIYLTYSSSETGIDYCVGMLSTDSSNDLLDPRLWVKERYPVLQSDSERKLYGPGHNSFTKDENGNDIMVYHARNEKTIVGNPLYVANRHAFLMRITWDGNDRPVFRYR